MINQNFIGQVSYAQIKKTLTVLFLFICSVKYCNSQACDGISSMHPQKAGVKIATTSDGIISVSLEKSCYLKDFSLQVPLPLGCVQSPSLSILPLDSALNVPIYKPTAQFNKGGNWISIFLFLDTCVFIPGNTDFIKLKIDSLFAPLPLSLPPGGGLVLADLIDPSPKSGEPERRGDGCIDCVIPNDMGVFPNPFGNQGFYLRLNTASNWALCSLDGKILRKGIVSAWQKVKVDSERLPFGPMVLIYYPIGHPENKKSKLIFRIK